MPLFSNAKNLSFFGYCNYQIINNKKTKISGYDNLVTEYNDTLYKINNFTIKKSTKILASKKKIKKKTFVKGSYVFYTFNYRRLCDMQNF